MIQPIENMRQLKIIISGGGSGGHIFPAIAIAKSIAQKRKNVERIKISMQFLFNFGPWTGIMNC